MGQQQSNLQQNSGSWIKGREVSINHNENFPIDVELRDNSLKETDKNILNEIDFNLYLSNSSELMKGWLEKQPKLQGKATGRQSRKWQNRFFVLEKGCLYYYTSTVDEILQNIGKTTVTSINRVPVKLNISGSTKIGYQFTLQYHQNKDILQLAAATEEDMDSWINFFSNMENKQKEGWLMLFSNSKKWTLKYIIVKNDIIEICSREQKGFIPLVDATVEISDISSLGGYFGFCITTQNFTINLRTNTEELRKLWMEKISSEIQRLSIENEKLTDKIYIYFILSIDGGGIRGIITTTILERLIQHFPDLIEHTDFITGCSNGAMVAMALAFDHDPKFCRMLLELTGDTILKTTWSSNKMNAAKFRNNHLKLFCDLIWGDKKLKDAKYNIMIPAFLMDNHHPDKKKRSCECRIFHNLKGDNNGNEELASDVVMRSIAAPTFFPSYQQYVDGGIFAHDPSSLALNLSISPLRMGIKPEKIVLLSLGTGKVNYYYDDPNHDWGYVQWLPKLPYCFWDGMLGKSELICKEILGDKYMRIDPILEKEIPMDDPLQIPILVEIAKSYDLTEVIKWIFDYIYDDEDINKNSGDEKFSFDTNI